MLREQVRSNGKHPTARKNINYTAATGIALLVCMLILAGCSSSGSGGSQTGVGQSQAGSGKASAGCGKAPPSAAGNSDDETMISGGLTRGYRLHIPAGYQADRGQALVLDFHGHGAQDYGEEAYSGFSVLADKDDFIVVYPQGTIGPDGQTGWASGGSIDPAINDVFFVSDLLNHLQSILCIDAQRIYAAGISNGGGMTGLLACQLSGRIAAFAPVAGAFYPIVGGCHPDRAVPILEFHGTADPLVTYTGVPRVSLPPIPQWLQGWATRDGCTGGPTIFFKKAEVTGEQWTGCQGGATVVHYRIDGGGHTWPGAFNIPLLGYTTHTINATALMWQFFQAHPLG